MTLSVNRFLSLVLLIALLVALLPAPAAAQRASDPIAQLMAQMTPAEKVGQLFLVTYVGNDVGPNSDIARLIRDYRIGGVVLLPSNGNFRNEGDTPTQLARLTNALQSIALNQPITPTGTLTGTTPTPTVTRATAPLTRTTPIPLLIAIDQEGDGFPYTRLISGFTPLPSNMALGATWSEAHAEAVGALVGQELATVGVNLLLGPSLDVLDTPHPTLKGDMGVRSFGGDPFWVGRWGQAYIRGVHEGSKGRVATIAKHFPGQGGSDRRPDEEVATVQKSLEQLKQIELAPFAAVAQGAPGTSEAPAVTDGFMTSHIRYRGLQGNIRQLTPPISLAPQLQDVLALDAFAPWREAGGILVTDALGAPGVKRVYDPQLQKFPARQIAQDAFLAGNDLLLLSQFSLSGMWEEQLANTQATIQFFQEKYQNDKAFQAQVNQAVERILRLKRRLYPRFDAATVLVRPEDVKARVGQGGALMTQVAKEAITLLYPGRQELADRLPTAPLEDENILIITDTRLGRECPNCPSFPYVSRTALADIILRLYGPQGSGQIKEENVNSLTFGELKAYLTGITTTVPITVATPEVTPTPSLPGAAAGVTTTATVSDVASLIQSAQWIVFAMLDVDTETFPDSDAVKQFLRQRADVLRNKKVIVFALSAPYYLDTTEVSKLTAYFGVYSKTPPFLEMAVRALFREFTPSGTPPVSVAGIGYELITATEPNPAQVIPVGLKEEGPPTTGTPAPRVVKAGDTVRLIAGPILDRNGHIVPNGTPVTFRFFYPAESLELPRKEVTTKDGYAETSAVLQRTGELRVTASSGNALQSVTLVITIQGDQPGTVSTLVPTPTPTPSASPTPTATPTPSPTATPTSTPTASPTPTFAPTPVPLPPSPRVDGWAFVVALLTTLVVSAVPFVAQARALGLTQRIPLLLWGIIAALGAYILYGVGWLPGATALQREAGPWGAGAVTLVGGALPLAVYHLARAANGLRKM